MYVFKGSRFNLLGLSELKNLSQHAAIDEVCKDEFDPIKLYANVFEGLEIMPGTFRINLKDAAFVFM